MDLFQVLGDHSRREIIELLAKNGKMSATQISDKFSVSAPAISQHLKILHNHGFVDIEKKAQQRIYNLNPDPMYELNNWVSELMTSWSRKFDKLEDVLK